MKYLRLFLILLFLVSLTATAENQLFYFEPKVVKLTGIVKKLTFPGRPNYQNIKEGDEVERGPYLMLKYPIDVALPPPYEPMGNDEFTKNVSIIQLAVEKDEDYPKLKEGSFVHVKGTLYRVLYGHHHARILLFTTEVNVLGNKKAMLKNMGVTKEDYVEMFDDTHLPKLHLKIKSHN